MSPRRNVVTGFYAVGELVFPVAEVVRLLAPNSHEFGYCVGCAAMGLIQPVRAVVACFIRCLVRADHLRHNPFINVAQHLIGEFVTARILAQS